MDVPASVVADFPKRRMGEPQWNELASKILENKAYDPGSEGLLHFLQHLFHA